MAASIALIAVEFPRPVKVPRTLPSEMSVRREDVSPDVAWSGAPEGVASFALVVDDPDANDFLHWAVLDFAG